MPAIPSTIKNILFDFGGIILDIHHQKVEKAFADLGIVDFESLFNKANQSHIFQDFEKGTLDPSAFRDQLRNLTGLSVDDELFDGTWNKILGEYPTHRIALLKELAGNYRLFILSNTNAIHFQYFQNRFQSEYGFNFNSLFEKTYWSYQLGMRKPDPDPFLYILEKNGLLASETFFIDDSIQNIETAFELGFPSYWLNSDEDVTDLFKKGIIKTELSIFDGIK